MLIVLLGRKCHISNSKANSYYECIFPFVFTWLRHYICSTEGDNDKNYDTFCWWLWKVKLTSNSTYGYFLKILHKIQFIYRWNIIGQKRIWNKQLFIQEREQVCTCMEFHQVSILLNYLNKDDKKLDLYFIIIYE